MSAATHDVQADAHQRAAAEQEALAQPTRTEVETKCIGRPGGAGICCSDEHRRIAEEHRRIAAEHRDASAELRDAEARFCVGIDPSDRDLSPFLHEEDIAGVEPMYAPVTVAKSHAANLVGAVVEFRALMPAGVHAWVDSTDGHLIVSVKADDQASANEVYARASRLVQRPSSGEPSPGVR